jgi:hypothetical protein
MIGRGFETFIHTREFDHDGWFRPRARISVRFNSENLR